MPSMLSSSWDVILIKCNWIPRKKIICLPTNIVYLFIICEPRQYSSIINVFIFLEEESKFLFVITFFKDIEYQFILVDKIGWECFLTEV